MLVMQKRKRGTTKIEFLRKSSECWTWKKITGILIKKITGILIKIWKTERWIGKKTSQRKNRESKNSKMKNQKFMENNWANISRDNYLKVARSGNPRREKVPEICL